MTASAALAIAPTHAENPFAAFKIEHLSPSTCSKFVGSQAMFVLDKVLKRGGSVGAAAHRGTAVEDGVTHGLTHPGASLVECHQIALAKFEELTKGFPDEKLSKERDGLRGMIEQALIQLRGYGKPSGTQLKVSVDMPGISVPIIGYLDYEWEQHDVLADLKTTHMCPSAIKTDHARQVSLYKRARNRARAVISYNTPKRGETYLLDNADAHFEALVLISGTIQRFLALSTDPYELASLVMPDVESFYFNDPATRQAAFEIWKI